MILVRIALSMARFAMTIIAFAALPADWALRYLDERDAEPRRVVTRQEERRLRRAEDKILRGGQ